jgi:putative glutamine amidotransferase
MTAGARWRLFAQCLLSIGLVLACDPKGRGLRAPESGGASDLNGEHPLGPSAQASGAQEPTCACAKDKVEAETITSAETSGTSAPSLEPTIAYNGPVAGDVGSSAVEQRIRESGGRPLRLTPQNKHLITSAHGLVLVGGDDIDPKRYGERPHAKVRLLSPEREAFDFELIDQAARLRLPVLGICLGAQELWVAAKGTLIQDIPSEVGTRVNHRAKEALHAVSLVPGSRLAAIYGGKSLQVFSNHHQAIDAKTAAPVGFVVSASSSDGIAEAFEARSGDVFVLGVGWHPEKREQEHVLFDSLVTQAKAARREVPSSAHAH